MLLGNLFGLKIEEFSFWKELVMKTIGMISAIICILVIAIDSPAFGQLFGERTDYPAGDEPCAVFAADLDGDSDSDLALTNKESDNVSILLNNGDGTFQPAVNYATGNYPYLFYSADLDGDNDNDLAVANYYSNNISILLNNGDGTFQPAVNYGVGSGPPSVFPADLDGDNDLDLAVANQYSDNISILLNNGNGTFQSAVNYYAGDGAYAISSADLDGDNDSDVAVTNWYSDKVSILLNNGDGTFQSPYYYDVGDGPESIYSADLDGDNESDLAVTNYYTDNVSILLNNGDGTFQSTINYGAGDVPHSVFSTDLDGDNDNDLAVANAASDNVSILLNNGDGTFQTAVNYITGDGPWSVFSIDLDGDNISDLATANRFSNNVSILFNLGFYSSICASVNIAGNPPLPVKGITITVLDENNDPVGDPIATDENGEAYFDSITVGQYSVMMVTPLGYAVSPAETQTNVSVFSGDCTGVDFLLTPTVVTNDSRSIGYWKHQFNVYTSGRGNAQENYADLETYLNLVHQHFSVLGVYVDIENFNRNDAKNVLTVRAGSLMLDRAKQQLFALLLNLASAKIGQETVVSDDGRVSAEAVTYVSTLINDGNPENDELAKDICELINNGRLVEAGVIQESPVRYKFVPDVEPGMLYSVQNYPNPFNAQTTINFALPNASHVTIEVYDLLGRSVAVLVDSELPAGYHTAIWDADDQSSGMYFYKIQAGEFIETRKMLILK